MKNKSVLLVGASGLVGNECLKLLLADDSISKINILSRSSLSIHNPRLNEYITDFDDIEKHDEAFKVDSIICALGTTIKKAGSQEKFKLVDYHYPLQIANIGIKNGVKHFLVVSSLGANPKSKIFYNRVKGELESSLKQLNCESITVVRPSLLMGDRKEFRLGEEIGKRLRFLFSKNYKPIKASKVAECLIEKLKEAKAGFEIIESLEMNK
ncbi:MAG: NAD(P)H-binding protein [Ignavibacteriales bacterium]|nr:NAD(P)H-binding protein [Ignavibacteriales bacterium]